MAKKTENKTVVEKAAKVLSPKRQSELDHINGRHKTVPGDYEGVAQLNPLCGFCKRRVTKASR